MLKSRTSSLIVGFLLGLVAASLVFALLDRREGEDGAGKRLKIGHSLPTTHPVHAGIENMAERVAELSGGELVLDIFPNSQLGNETQMLEQVQTGTLAMIKVGGGSLGDFIPEFQVFSLPYVFHSRDHHWEVLDSDIGEEMLTALETDSDGDPSGFRGLCYYDAGSRNFYAVRPLPDLESLQGLKIRVQNNPVAMNMVNALGASPTPISWGELYTSLQQGVVDGAENNPPSFVSNRHFEVCKHFTFNHHSMVPDVVVISTEIWERLSPQEQDWLTQAANESSLYQRQAWETATAEAVEQMKAEGVTVYEPDLDPFIAGTAPVREKFASGKMKTILERIAALAD
ncbi:MAG: TRAP transporter substrate-binding protein [Verrucomicrobiota bacterium]